MLALFFFLFFIFPCIERYFLLSEIFFIWTPRSHITTMWNKQLLASDDSYWAMKYMDWILLVLQKLSAGFKWSDSFLQNCYFPFFFFFLTFDFSEELEASQDMSIFKNWEPVTSSPWGKNIIYYSM